MHWPPKKGRSDIRSSPSRQVVIPADTFQEKEREKIYFSFWFTFPYSQKWEQAIMTWGSQLLIECCIDNTMLQKPLVQNADKRKIGSSSQEKSRRNSSNPIVIIRWWLPWVFKFQGSIENWPDYDWQFTSYQGLLRW